MDILETLSPRECVFVSAVIVLLSVIIYQYKRKTVNTQQFTRLEELLAGERAGRVTAEKRLRKVLQGESGKTARFPPIGYIESPFTSRVGCPRQGGLVANVPSLIRLDPRIQPADSLLGLEQYSHLWLIWEFHDNTNLGGNVKAKVQPPRANGEKWGIYATRTPHRHNNIGLSLVKIHSLSADKRTLCVLGADLLDKTPILDIKPYTPGFEAIPGAIVPAWVGKDIEEYFEVEWSTTAKNIVKDLFTKQKYQFYMITEPAEFVKIVEDIVRLQDIRNKLQKQLHTREYSFLFDELTVHIQIIENTDTNTTVSNNDTTTKPGVSTATTTTGTGLRGTRSTGSTPSLTMSTRTRSMSRARNANTEQETKDSSVSSSASSFSGSVEQAAAVRTSLARSDTSDIQSVAQKVKNTIGKVIIQNITFHDKKENKKKNNKQ